MCARAEIGEFGPKRMRIECARRGDGAPDEIRVCEASAVELQVNGAAARAGHSEFAFQRSRSVLLPFEVSTAQRAVQLWRPRACHQTYVATQRTGCFEPKLAEPAQA